MSQKPVNVAINGFGRIGRTLLRVLADNPGVRVAAVNDMAETASLAYLLKYDSVHCRAPVEVSETQDGLLVNGKALRVLSEPAPGRLPWREIGVDIVVEATGRFVNGGAGEHLKAGAGRVIVSAPSTEADLTIVMGVNHADYDPSRHLIVSNASCTTNCLAPIARVIHDAFGIEKGLVTTIHSYTNDQKLMDSPHKDFRRGRSAALSIIPTTTGAAGAVGQVLPELKGKLDGVSVRVPTPDVSLADITLCLSKKTSAKEANLALKKASEGKLSGILGYSEAPLVSVDYLGSTYSAVVDSLQTRVMDGDLLKISAWYDNEWGYATRLAELILHLAPRLN